MFFKYKIIYKMFFLFILLIIKKKNNYKTRTTNLEKEYYKQVKNNLKDN